MPDPYLIPGTVVLQNKLGISDFDELEQAVADISDAMAYRLFDKNTPVPQRRSNLVHNEFVNRLAVTLNPIWFESRQCV
jgi:hypothetical protein